MLINNALLDSSDGLVMDEKRLLFQFSRFSEDLEDVENHVCHGEPYRQLLKRIVKGLPNSNQALTIKGEYHLGISPYIQSYYHFICDLLPHLIIQPQFPVLIPEWIPFGFKKFLNDCGFEFKVLPTGIFRIERLRIPEITEQDWNLQKIASIKEFIKKRFHFQKLDSQITSSERIYISRKQVKRRHLRNEEKIKPILDEFGYKTVILEQWPILHQIALFEKITHLVSPHGAGLVNVLFSRSDTRILEIRPIIFSGKFCFESLFGYGWKRHEVVVPTKQSRFEISLKSLEGVLSRWDNDSCFTA